ncbi:MAG: beta strand repeat-containing protein, partial [Candidatus Saccharimonadales bacterium]
GNGNTNGGTYLSIVEPSSGSGSAADFFNLQNGSTVEMQLTATGDLTVNGKYDTNTFNNNTLGFGGNSAATINSSGSNNLTVDTGSSGGTETLGNNAATTNIGTSNAAHTIGIGTGAGGTATQAITIGEATNSSSTLALQGGNGSGAVSLLTGNNGTTAGSIQIGNTSGAFNQSINIGNNNSAANTVNIGVGTGQDSVTIGDTTTATSAVNIKAGSTGGITLGANTKLSANSNLTYAAGTGKFDASNASGTFDTTTGTNHLNGATTVTGTNTFTVNGGATTLNGAAAGSSTAVQVNTNAATNTGVVIQGASSQSAPLLQVQDSTGAALLNVTASGDIDQLGNFNTPYAGVGNYGNLLVQSEQLGTSWTASNITVTQNDGASNPAPDGNTTADKLVSTASGTHTLTQTYSSAGNNAYTFSIWLKTSTPPQAVQLRIDSNGTPATGTAASFNVAGNWQRYSITQTFTGGVTSVTPTLVMVNNNSGIVGWGAQLVQGSSAGVYSRTGSAAVSAGSGLLDNQSAVFQALTNSATAYQFQNSSGINVATIDTSANQLVLGTAGASGVSGQIAFNYTGQTGSVTLAVANPSSTDYTITLPAENGQICTTAASAACAAVYATNTGTSVLLAPSTVQADSSTNNSIFINKTGASGNILELQKSNSDVFKVDNSGNLSSTGSVDNSGQNTLSRNSSGANDYTLGVTGTTSATGTSSLVRIGGTLAGGNGVANGGTYLSIVEPSSGSGSAADFFDLQNGSTVELQLTATGDLTVNGKYDTNTFNSNTLGFGGNSAATISSSGSNNLTVDTGSSGGTLALGNNAATTNVGTSNAAHTIGIGTGGGGTNTQAITIGAATNSSSTLTLQGGNGTGAISLLTGNNGTSAGTIQIGNTSGGFNQSISIGNNNAAANTVNIGVGTGQDSVIIGDTTTSTSAVNIKAGSTGGITLGANTNLSANSNLTYTAGTGKFDASNASGSFDTTTGTNHLNGATTVTGTNSFTVNGGATTLNGLAAGSSPAVTVATNAASNTGVLIQGAASQTADLLQLQDSTGATVLSGSAAGSINQLGNFNTPFAGIGSYGNLLLRSEQFDNAAWTAANVTVTANDGASNPAPDGNTTADKLVSSTSGAHTVTQSYGSAGNNTYTFSVWVKTNSSSAPVQLRIDSNGTPATGTAASFTATTTWQRFAVTQSFSSGVTTITPTIVITNNNTTVVGWGAQLVQASAAGQYVRTVASTVATSSGLVDDGNAIFVPGTDSTAAYQFQNSSGVNVAAIDTSGGQLVLGTAGASGVSGQIKLNYAGQTGSVTLAVANPSSTGYTITIPAE